MDTTTEQPSFDTSALETFRVNMQAAEKDPQVEQKPAPEKTAATPQKEDDNEIPDHILTGTPVKNQQTETDLDEELLKAEPPATMSEKSRVNFKALQTAASKKIEALKKQLEESSKNKPVDSPEISERLKAAEARAKEIETELERAAFERSPKFKSFLTKESEEITAAKSYVDEAEANLIEQAANAKGSKRIELLKEANLDPETISLISPYLARVDAIRRERNSALESWKETNRQWELEQQTINEQKEAKQRELEETVFTKVFEDVSKKFEPFQKVDGNEKWNTQVDRLNSEAKEFFSGNMPLEKLAEISTYGVGAKVIHKMFHTLQTKYNEVIEENAQLKSASPGGGSTVPKEESVDNNASFEDAAMSTFRKSIGA